VSIVVPFGMQQQMEDTLPHLAGAVTMMMMMMVARTWEFVRLTRRLYKKVAFALQMKFRIPGISLLSLIFDVLLWTSSTR
jgi:hypothetical protein